MHNFKQCCRLCIKQDQPVMKDCANDLLAGTIRELFGIELVVNGPLPTKICGDCISRVLEINFFKITVQNNQQSTLKTLRVLEESVKKIPVVKKEENEAIILISDSPKRGKNERNIKTPEHNIKKSKPVETEKQVKTFAAKRSLSSEPDPAESSAPRRGKLRKCIVLCQPINAKDLSKVELKRERVLKMNEKKVEPEKQFNEIERKSCKSKAPLATTNLVTSFPSESHDEDNMTIKEYIKKYSNKKSAESSSTTNTNYSIMLNVSTTTTSKNTEQEKILKLFIYDGKVFNDLIQVVVQAKKHYNMYM